jgi:hypothetical protein
MNTINICKYKDAQDALRNSDLAQYPIVFDRARTAAEEKK